MSQVLRCVECLNDGGLHVEALTITGGNALCQHHYWEQRKRNE